MLSGIVRKFGDASKDKDGLVETAAGLRATKRDDECLFSSLLDEERDSFDVHPPYWLGVFLTDRKGGVTFRFFWMFSFFIVFPFCISSTYLRKSKSSW